jgi:hypothetical protein
MKLKKIGIRKTKRGLSKNSTGIAGKRKIRLFEDASEEIEKKKKNDVAKERTKSRD